jgi:hypothetical protein
MTHTLYPDRQLTSFGWESTHFCIARSGFLMGKKEDKESAKNGMFGG